jgi:small subunit ribosomal protein S20
MANTPQSKKRARQSEKRFAVNKARRSRIRTFLRKVEEAIAAGNAEAAKDALRAAQPELARGVTKGVLHKNTGGAQDVAAVGPREGADHLTGPRRALITGTPRNPLTPRSAPETVRFFVAPTLRAATTLRCGRKRTLPPILSI